MKQMVVVLAVLFAACGGEVMTWKSGARPGEIEVVSYGDDAEIPANPYERPYEDDNERSGPRRLETLDDLPAGPLRVFAGALREPMGNCPTEMVIPFTDPDSLIPPSTHNIAVKECDVRTGKHGEADIWAVRCKLTSPDAPPAVLFRALFQWPERTEHGRTARPAGFTHTIAVPGPRKTPLTRCDWFGYTMEKSFDEPRTTDI